MILKARGPGIFCSKRLNGTKVGEMDQIFGKVQSGAIYLNFLGPAAGKRRQFRKLYDIFLHVLL